MKDRVKLHIENHIAYVSLNRAEKMNALDEDMLQAIITTGEELDKNKTVRAVVLSGEGKAFCAGIDVANFSFDPDTPSLVEGLELRSHGITNKYQHVAWVWRKLAVPVIAAAHGVVFGGGLQIMLGADIKFIKPDTKLSIMEMKWGLIPDMAGPTLMRLTVREDIIREFTYTHRVFSGEEAVQYGFATHLSENPLEDATKLAQEIASKSPTAIVKSKKLLNAVPYLNAQEALLMESVEQKEIIGKKNQMEAIFSSLQKKPGNFQDYRE